MRTLSFISGKGGVGKTTLAANLAMMICESGRRALLVDLDLQNLGCTGLMAANFELGEARSVDLLDEGATDETFAAITQIEANLLFLPGVLSSSFDAITRSEGSRQVARRIRESIERVARLHAVDFCILDCHGGLDPLSIAAVAVADDVLIVTEPDPVTFAGTLALLDAWYRDQGIGALARAGFVVNRIPSSFNYQDLYRTYQRSLESYFATFPEGKIQALDRSEMARLLAFIPAASYLSDSFGEYPFVVRVAEKSLLTKKLALIAKRLRVPVAGKYAQLVADEKLERKVEGRMTTSETRLVKGALSTATFGAVVVSMFAGLSLLTFNTELLDGEGDIVNFLGVLWFVSTPLIHLLLLIVMLQISFYFRGRLAFRKRLLQLVPAAKARWRRLGLWKERSFYGLAATSTAVLLLLFTFNFTEAFWVSWISGWMVFDWGDFFAELFKVGAEN